MTLGRIKAYQFSRALTLYWGILGEVRTGLLFPTIQFGIFFLCVFMVAWALKQARRARKWFLIVASYFFYGVWDWRFTFLLLQCSVLNFLLGRWLARCSVASRKRIVGLGVGLNLATLGFFKYYGFFLNSLNETLFRFGLEGDLPIFEIVLPVGISFFTFQGLSYLVDVYRGQLKPVHKLEDVLLYISFFPQLVAGPIVRAKDFFGQLSAPLAWDNIPFGHAFRLIMFGLFKKMVIANYLSTLIVDDVFQDPSSYSAIDVLFGVYGYAVQIYCDFSAYSDIAIGVAALLGYQFLPNFDAPYRAHSLQNFWRRWHISLSTWLRDYLYISLGGSRRGPLFTYRNLFLTMLLGGLWHGAAWNFVVWGALHGSALGLERLLRQRFGGFLMKSRIGVGLRIAFVFHFVCVTWVFFRAESFLIASEVFRTIGNGSWVPEKLTPFVLIVLCVGLGSQWIPTRTIERFEVSILHMPPVIQGLAVAVFLTLIGGLAPDGVAPFIYFQF